MERGRFFYYTCKNYVMQFFILNALLTFVNCIIALAEGSVDFNTQFMSWSNLFRKRGSISTMQFYSCQLGCVYTIWCFFIQHWKLSSSHIVRFLNFWLWKESFSSRFGNYFELDVVLYPTNQARNIHPYFSRQSPWVIQIMWYRAVWSTLHSECCFGKLSNDPNLVIKWIN